MISRINYYNQQIYNNKLQNLTRREGKYEFNDKLYFGSKNQLDEKRKAGLLGRTIITLGSAFGVILADLLLTKGKALSGLSRGKISFISHMSDDIENILKKDAAAKSRMEVLLCYPGLHALWNHRVAYKLQQWKIPVLPRLISSISRFFTGIEVHPGAKIGKNLFIDHTGAIIGETAEIGNNVEIIGRVVLGSTGKDKNLRHTIVEDNVTIGMNSTMLGRIRLGKNSKIGAGAVVTHNVPENATVIGNPAKIISIGGVRLPEPVILTRHSEDEIKVEF